MKDAKEDDGSLVSTEPTYRGHRADLNNSAQYKNGMAELSFEEEDTPLVDKTVLGGKSRYGALNDTCSPCSENPESESQLSMKHLSEGGKAMRTTDPVAS